MIDEREYTIANELYPNRWVESISFFKRFWYNPIIQIRFGVPNKKQLIFFTKTWWYEIVALVFGFGAIFYSLSTIQRRWLDPIGSDVKTVLDNLDLTYLITLPTQWAWVFSLVFFITVLSKAPKRLNELANRDKTDPVLTTQLSDAYIFLGECFAPGLFLSNMISMAIILILVFAFTFIVVDSPAFGERLPGVSFAMSFFGNAFGYSGLLVLIGIMWGLIYLIGVFLTGLFGLCFKVFPTWILTLTSLVVIYLLGKWVALFGLQFFFPNYIDPFRIPLLYIFLPFLHNDLTIESGFPFILSFLVFDVILALVCFITYRIGIRIFSRIRRRS